MNTVKY